MKVEEAIEGQGMWEKITPYINSGKRLKLKGDKMIAILIQNRFEGTLFVHAGSVTEELVFQSGDIHTAKSPSFFTFSLQSALFSLATSMNPQGNSLPAFLFLYEIVKGYPPDMLRHLLEQYKTENVTLKPEAGRFDFLRDDLARCSGKQSVPVIELYLEHTHALYFLLLTENAAIIRASDLEKQKALEEERRRVEEMKQGKEKRTLEDSDEWRELDVFVKRTFRYESIFALFGWKEGDDLQNAHKNYIRFVQKLHPDKLHSAPEMLRDKANELLSVINSVYPLLKDDAERVRLISLSKKFGDIRTKERFEELLAVEDLLLRADGLYKMGEFGKAYKIYVEMFGRTKAPWLLEKMVYAYYNNRRPEEDAAKGIVNERRVTLEGKYMKIRDYIQRLRDFKSALPLEILYILADVYEKERNFVMLRKTLHEILILYPGETKATGWLKKVDEFIQQSRKKAQ